MKRHPDFKNALNYFNKTVHKNRGLKEKIKKLKLISENKKLL